MVALCQKSQYIFQRQLLVELSTHTVAFLGQVCCCKMATNQKGQATVNPKFQGKRVQHPDFLF